MKWDIIWLNSNLISKGAVLVISNDEKKKILHLRWAITAFIAFIFITAMELWSIVFAIFFMW